MRRFATFVGLASLVAACGSGDIVVKTDLNETFTIKDSTITTSDYPLEGIISDLISSRDTSSKALSGIQQKINECASDGIISYSRCKDIFSKFIINREREIASDNAKIQTIERLKSSVSPAVKTVKYRAVFTDLNGQKSALPYSLLQCVSPRINQADAKSLLEAMRKKDSIVTVMSTKAAETAALQVCRKHAFKNTNILSMQII